MVYDPYPNVVPALCHEVLSFWRKIKTAADRNNEQRSFKVTANLLGCLPGDLS